MSVLSDEIANDPLGRGYAGMTNQEAADSMNVVDIADAIEASPREVARARRELAKRT